MRNLKFLITGVFFGIILTKAEVISWYRIFEMFRFDSFHMYGVIGSAVLLGIIVTTYLKRNNFKSYDGHFITFNPKDKRYKASIFGGTLFGFGWAMTGACPGPMYILLGNGFTVFIVVILSALFGTFIYGLIQNKLPH